MLAKMLADIGRRNTCNRDGNSRKQEQKKVEELLWLGCANGTATSAVVLRTTDTSGHADISGGSISIGDSTGGSRSNQERHEAPVRGRFLNYNLAPLPQKSRRHSENWR
mmetsp:Transcript_6504/g.10110  ORF Transcript_6504/g.10110 Transcript_6504/m.10110 type:complete len:109 (+) Transcript_6504:211-537(+)